jgi:hypothetical protein
VRSNFDFLLDLDRFLAVLTLTFSFPSASFSTGFCSFKDFAPTFSTFLASHFARLEDLLLASVVCFEAAAGFETCFDFSFLLSAGVDTCLSLEVELPLSLLFRLLGLAGVDTCLSPSTLTFASALADFAARLSFRFSDRLIFPFPLGSLARMESDLGSFGVEVDFEPTRPSMDDDPGASAMEASED